MTDDGLMLWELAHRAAEAATSTTVTIESASSWDAVEELRMQLPEGERVLYVRSLS